LLRIVTTDFLALRLFCFSMRQHGRQILYFKLHVDGRKFYYKRPHAAGRPQVVHRCYKQTLAQNCRQNVFTRGPLRLCRGLDILKIW